jgi:hypothetical protein
MPISSASIAPHTHRHTSLRRPAPNQVRPQGDSSRELLNQPQTKPACIHPSWTFVPDALQDSTQVRRSRARRRLRYGAGLLPRLLIAADHALIHVVVPLGMGTPADLYSPKVNAHARKTGLEVIGAAPAWTCLERGLTGNLHLHIVTARSAILKLPSGSYTKVVDEAFKLICYLSKPADARACQAYSARTKRRTPPDPTLLNDAIRDYLHARTQGRRVRLSWTTNLPRLRPSMSYVLQTPPLASNCASAV